MNLITRVPLPGSGTECLRLSGNNHSVQGNLIGTDRSGTLDRGCTTGLLLSGPNNAQIGGALPGHGNVISGHDSNAFQITDNNDPARYLARIQGNRIGVDVNGAELPNATAIPDSQSFAVMTLRGDNSASNVLIGGLGNGEGNVIAFSGEGGTPNPGTPPYFQAPAIGLPGRWEVLGNRFVGNRGLGVDVQNGAIPRLPNDPGDGDSVNGSFAQNFPAISASSLNGNQLQLTYRVDSAFSATPLAGQSIYPLTVEFYKSDGAAGSELLDSDVYLDSEAQQAKTITLTVPANLNIGPNDVIVATATDSPPAGRVTGNTSEFSFYPLGSFEIISISPSPISIGRPYTVRVRATAAAGSPFKPNGIAQIQVDQQGAPTLGRCEAQLLPVAAALTSEGECVLTAAASPAASRCMRATTSPWARLPSPTAAIQSSSCNG